MKDIVEIRWHGRGGQGAKTASLLLADAAFNTGKYVQGFPEYGPERMGAPITAYNRISSERSTVHSNIYEPDYVVVVDETLLSAVDVTAGLKKWGRTFPTPPCWPPSSRSPVWWSLTRLSKIWRLLSITSLPPNLRSSRGICAL